MAGIDLQDSNRLTVSTGSPQKDGAGFMAVESMEAETRQLPQATCTVQSDASRWCIGDADRLADNKEARNKMASATRIFLFFANGRTF